MPKTRLLLQPILKLLERKPLTTPEITKKLKKHRKVIGDNLIWASQKGWIEKDSLGRNQLTMHGKSIIGKDEKPMNSTVFEVRSHVLSAPDIMKGRLSAKCILYAENVQRIMELDKDTREYQAALMMSGYGKMENATNIQASAGALVDAILDSVAKDIGLFSTLKSEHLYAIDDFNYETMPVGYDIMKRFKQLAGTKFKFFMEFDGAKWVKKQNFRKLEKEHQILHATSKNSLNRIRSLDDRHKIMFIVYKLIDPDWKNEDTLESMHSFETKKELENHVYMLFKRFGIEKVKIEEILQKGFESGFFQTEKRTVHQLTINRGNESKFFKALSFQSQNSKSLEGEPVSHMVESKKGEKQKDLDSRRADPKYFVAMVSKQLDTFERTFFNMLERTIDRFEKAKFIDGQLDTYPRLDGREPVHLKAAKESLLQLLDIFYETTNVCMLRSAILWPQKIKDQKLLYTLNSIVFNKITDMRQVLYQALSSFHSGQFNSDFVNYAMAGTYATQTFLKYHNTFRNSGVEKESEPLMDSIWSLYEEIKEWAFPEPSMYSWDFDHNRDGWKKFLEIQGKHPNQTSDNYFKNYMRQYGSALKTER